jgi:tetratricopeptide (TPR) repeat protein
VAKRAVEAAAVVLLGVGLYGAWQSYAPAHRLAAPANAAGGTVAAPSAPDAGVRPAPPPSAGGLAAAPDVDLAPAELDQMRQIQAHFATGDFMKALHLADAGLAASKGTPAFLDWLKAQLPVLLTSAGWTRLKLGDCDEATQLLHRSESLKRTPETTKGLAVCYYKQKNLAGAREQLTSYLEGRPDDLQMQLLYADLLESDGNYDQAVHVLEQVAEGARKPGVDPATLPDAADLQRRLESMRGRAKESTLQSSDTSRNFRLAYRAGEHEDLVPFVFQTLEDALDEYVENYGFRPPPAPIEVGLTPPTPSATSSSAAPLGRKASSTAACASPYAPTSSRAATSAR